MTDKQNEVELLPCAMIEEWRSVDGYEGCYEVSSHGRVRSVIRQILSGNHYQTANGKMLKLKELGGYFVIGLKKHNVASTKSVHRLVAAAFIPNPNNLPQINHKDENPLNNHVDNLEWCSPKYNANYGTRNQRLSLALRAKARKVVQVDTNGNDVRIFDSVKDAAQYFGISKSLISGICRCEYRRPRLWLKYANAITPPLPVREGM